MSQKETQSKRLVDLIELFGMFLKILIGLWCMLSCLHGVACHLCAHGEAGV